MFRFDKLQPKHTSSLSICYSTKTLAMPRKVLRRRGIRLDAQNASKHNTLIVRTIFFRKFRQNAEKVRFQDTKRSFGTHFFYRNSVAKHQTRRAELTNFACRVCNFRVLHCKSSLAAFIFEAFRKTRFGTFRPPAK